MNLETYMNSMKDIETRDERVAQTMKLTKADIIELIDPDTVEIPKGSKKEDIAAQLVDLYFYEQLEEPEVSSEPEPVQSVVEPLVIPTKSLTGKAKQLAEVSNLLNKHSIDPESDLFKELTELFKPKRNTIPSDTEPKYENGEITECYCIKFRRYFPVEEFATSKKTKYGYARESRRGVKLWKVFTSKLDEIKEAIQMEKDAVFDGVKTREEATEEISSLNQELGHFKELRASEYTEELFNEFVQTKES